MRTTTKLIALTLITLCAPGYAMAQEPSAEVAGPDKNKNGVRDDIDAYIDETYKVAAQHAAVIQFAKTQQQVLSVAKDDQAAAKKVNQVESDARNCVTKQFPKDSGDLIVFEKIVSMTFNNDPRINIYSDYKVTMNGEDMPPSSADTCE